MADELGLIPILWYDAPAALGSYSLNGTPVVTGSRTDPLGRTGAFEIEDNDVGSAEGIYKDPTVALVGDHFIWIVWKEGAVQTAARESTLRFLNFTTSTDILRLDMDWTTGISSKIAGHANSKHIADFSLGDGWYITVGLAHVTATDVADTMRILVLPTNLTAAQQGSVYVYPRPFVTPGVPLDLPRVRSLLGAEYERAESPAGVVDTWLPGQRDALTATVRRIPSLEPDNNVAAPFASPWDSEWRSEMPFLDLGWRAFIETAASARGTNPVTFCPDRTDPDLRVVDLILDSTPDQVPGIEDDGTKSFELELRGEGAGRKFLGL